MNYNMSSKETPMKDENKFQRSTFFERINAKRDLLSQLSFLL